MDAEVVVHVGCEERESEAEERAQDAVGGQDGGSVEGVGVY